MVNILVYVILRPVGLFPFIVPKRADQHILYVVTYIIVLHFTL